MTHAVPSLDEDLFARLRLLRSPRVGPIAYRQLLRRFGSAEAALAALPELAAPVRIEAEIRAVSRLGACYLVEGRPGYPSLLAQVEGSPPILIARGDPALADRRPLAIVGARNASAGACRLAREMAHGLATAGHAVVSGLARGVDGAAHHGALGANGAGTIAVIAHGMDRAYPSEHARLQAQIADEGLLLSEYPPGTEPLARHFPARNRVIAGLALGTVVAEAALRSGSLLTARLAGEYGREVMAIPGSPLDPRSQGCNRLIRDGATLVQDASEVIEAVSGFGGAPRVDLFAGAHRLEPDDARPLIEFPSTGIADLLGQAPVAIDDLVRASGAPAQSVHQALVELELAGRLHRHAGGKVSLAS